MACCGTFLKVSASVLVALAAVLAYFHLECQKEREAKDKTSKFDPFDPKRTDAREVPLKFCDRGTESEMYIGIEIMLEQSAPCAVVKLGRDSIQSHKLSRKLSPKVSQILYRRSCLH